MLAAPFNGRMRHEHNQGTVSATPLGTQITTGGAAGTKGTAVQLIAATSFDAFWIVIEAAEYGSSTAASEGCLDILAGAATEQVLIPDLLMGYCGGWAQAFQGPKQWAFPLFIPAGTRLAARAAGAGTSTALRVSVHLFGGVDPPFPCGTFVTTYGVSVPNGTTISPGASGAEGAWAQLTASTSHRHMALVPSFQPQADNTINLRNYLVDIGVGAATEEEVAQSYAFTADGGEHMSGAYPCFPMFCDIPAGQRLTMRASNSGANDGGYGGAIHAVS